MNGDAPRLIQDRTGFPMLWLEPLDAYLGWYPVTKIQFEQFLCETADDRFGPRWYDEVLGLNPRVAPSAVEPASYWRSLLSGVLPAEAECFARWMGDRYRLPTCAEWADAFDHLRRTETQAVEWKRVLLDRASTRCLT
ncbi:MAG: formylglycine-generating enzyme family protein, partial [Acidobacteriota bacterium]|nr:formylglycine-generating enzyme family protein [Acidobacteriota bacterium]